MANIFSNALQFMLKMSDLWFIVKSLSCAVLQAKAIRAVNSIAQGMKKPTPAWCKALVPLPLDVSVAYVFVAQDVIFSVWFCCPCLQPLESQ